MIDHETHLTVETGIIPTIGIEATQIAEISDTKTTDQEIMQITDQIIINLITITIKRDHEISRKIEIQTTKIDKETIPNHLIGIITVIPIFKTNI